MAIRLAKNGRVLLTALACWALVGGTVWGASETPQRGGTLRVGVASDVKTLDPTFSVQFTEREVLYLVYNTLVKLAPDFSIEPELARSWDILDGGTRIVFHLQQGVKFHDGTPFDASAAKWNMDRRLDAKVNSPQRKGLLPIIKSVEVMDKSTIVFHLATPYPGLFGLLGQREGYMVSPAAVERWGQDFSSHPVGTGPFKFIEWVRGSHITVERNPDYWESGKPYLDKVVFNDIAGSVVGAQRLLTRELDIVGQLGPQAVDQLASNAHIKLYPIKVGRWYALQWHWDEAPFNKAPLRMAIAHAIDRNKLVQVVMNGRGTVAEGPTPPSLWWYDPKVKAPAYDPGLARKRLAEAGYPNGVELTMTVSTDAVFQTLAQLVQEQLGAVGIKVKLEPVAASEYYARVVKRIINFTPTRWTQRADPDGLLFILFHGKGFANTTGYHNPKADDLLDRARVSLSQKERKALYGEFQQILTQDLPYVPLFFSEEYAAARDVVRGFEWIPDQIPRYRDLWKSAP